MGWGFWAIGRQRVRAAHPLPPAPLLPGRLAIILPACNERDAIGGVIRRIPTSALEAEGWVPRVIVVDDGSSDDTADVALQAGATVVSHRRNRGLGAALRTGLERAREADARAAIYLDADGEYDPAQMPRLLAPLAAGEADYVLGSRFLGRREGMSWQRTLANRGFTLLTSVLAGVRLTDAQTGYRAFSRRALERAEIIHDYNYAQVLTLDLVRKGMRLREVPVDYSLRRTGRSFIRGAEYCRKVLPAIARELLAD
jgi:glycosyltransferase involved in cell wall biosynthesis